ncbi:hypothetical protein J1792_33405 [Streptomyces triculaminicus]|uniref:Uncharacterized protein n=1 Tax=Streptomyces triculaminicus TaxID=2816232 RepID=A0A939FU76_9ACTN|nr:hypothetical protein [Streptomyces triculaminicus]MBO0657437.1 hypothetical protein [Streptomyces triculaminicus]
MRTVPHLRGGLDLSRVDVLDPAVLADLTELRYLSLTGRQWTALLDKGGVPPRPHRRLPGRRGRHP